MTKDKAVQIVPQKIKLAAGNNTLTIQWSDGHLSAYPYRQLRDRCPCATCTESGGPRPAVPNPLALYTKALKPDRAELVGRYALQLRADCLADTGRARPVVVDIRDDAPEPPVVTTSSLDPHLGPAEGIEVGESALDQPLPLHEGELDVATQLAGDVCSDDWPCPATPRGGTGQARFLRRPVAGDQQGRPHAQHRGPRGRQGDRDRA